MEKTSYNPTSIDLKDLKTPLQRIAHDMDCSLNWLVRKMLSEHPSLAEYLKEREKKKVA